MRVVVVVLVRWLTMVDAAAEVEVLPNQFEHTSLHARQPDYEFATLAVIIFAGRLPSEEGNLRQHNDLVHVKFSFPAPVVFWAEYFHVRALISLAHLELLFEVLGRTPP